jgi:hypothetical protein
LRKENNVIKLPESSPRVCCQKLRRHPAALITVIPFIAVVVCSLQKPVMVLSVYSSIPLFKPAGRMGNSQPAHLVAILIAVSLVAGHSWNPGCLSVMMAVWQPP